MCFAHFNMNNNISKIKKYLGSSEKGSGTLFVIILLVVVGGGTIFGGSGITKKVYEKGCGDALKKWESGQTYGDLGSIDNGQAIEDAIKCKKAVYNAVEVAKPMAALMSSANNIGVSNDNLAGVFVDRVMDQVEKSSEQNSEPPTKNESLPEDIKEKIKEEDKDDESSKVTDFFDNIEDKIQGIDIEGDSDDDVKTENKPTDNKSTDTDSCLIGFSGTSAPKLVWDCPEESQTSISSHFSDSEGDIKSMAMRFIAIMPEYNGRQELEWFTTDINESRKCGSDINPPSYLPEEFKDIKAEWTIEGYLIDSAGNKSNVESCVIFDNL